VKKILEICLYTLEGKEAVAKFRIFSGHDCLARHLKRMNLIGLDICVLCNQNSIMNSDHLFQCSPLSRQRQQAKYISSLYWEARGKMVKSKILVIRKKQESEIREVGAGIYV
jgi:hypothetical protein